MENVIEKRSEILFCYDVTDANPNGDPMDENKPRIDEENKINIVTDVRLKRTIRDYLTEYKGYNGSNGKDVFVREKLMDETKKESGIQDGKTRAKDYKNNPEQILKSCIDVRLFGGVIPLEKDSITYTGPVQFKMGRSLLPVELKHIKGTGAFASKPGSHNKTFRDEYILYYSFIAFHGIINETAAKHTQLTEEDTKELLAGMWHGTKNLITRSKFGQMPRLLIRVTYKEPGFFIGDLEKKIKMVSAENPLKIRSTNDFVIDMAELIKLFETNNEKIDSVSYQTDSDLKFAGESKIPENWKSLDL